MNSLCSAESLVFLTLYLQYVGICLLKYCLLKPDSVTNGYVLINTLLFRSHKMSHDNVRSV